MVHVGTKLKPLNDLTIRSRHRMKRTSSALALMAALAVVGALPNHRVNQTRRVLGPPDLAEICNPATEVCHRYGKMNAPLDHADPAQGSHEIAYFVNSDFWDPVGKPNGPIFINMW